jgi:hypothetical protein
MKSSVTKPNEEETMSRPSEVYVRPLSQQEEEWVHRLYQQTTPVGLKSRCHIILLSAQHYSVPQIAALLFSSEDTVACCIHEFNRSGLEGILCLSREKGLIEWVSGKLYWATSDHKNNALFRSALSQLIEPDAGQLVRKKYVVVDNYRIHFAKPVLAFLVAHQDEIELMCLPTYSPKLNPIYLV